MCTDKKAPPGGVGGAEDFQTYIGACALIIGRQPTQKLQSRTSSGGMRSLWEPS